MHFNANFHVSDFRLQFCKYSSPKMFCFGKKTSNVRYGERNLFFWGLKKDLHDSILMDFILHEIPIEKQREKKTFKFSSLKLELMKRFIGSHRETIECKTLCYIWHREEKKIAQSIKKTDSEHHNKLSLDLFNPFRNYQFPRTFYLSQNCFGQRNKEGKKSFCFYCLRGKWRNRSRGKIRRKIESQSQFVIRCQRIIFIVIQILLNNPAMNG